MTDNLDKINCKCDRVFHKGDIISYNRTLFVCDTDSTINLPTRSNSDWRRLTDKELNDLLRDDIEPISIEYKPDLNNNAS